MDKQKTGSATPLNVATKGATTSSDLDKILAMPTGGASGCLLYTSPSPRD